MTCTILGSRGPGPDIEVDCTMSAQAAAGAQRAAEDAGAGGAVRHQARVRGPHH